MPFTEDQALDWFLAWLEDDPVGGSVGPMLDRYRQHLRGVVGEDEVEPALDSALGKLDSRVDVWEKLFDKIYAFPEPGFDTEPNALVVEAANLTEPGDGLDVAMGQGRNALYLASKGWRVTGIDVSGVGVETARLEARTRGLEIDALVADHRSYDYGSERWDLMVFTYTPVSLTIAETVDRLRTALRRGGRVVVESFMAPADAEDRRPVDLDSDDLAAAFAGFDIELFEVDEAVTDWDRVAQPRLRMIAAKV